ncbi:MAG: NYN domain-containing protein [Candidatus Planktophila sp.]
MSNKAVVVIDYQNLHLTAVDVFGTKNKAFDSLIDPLLYSEELLRERKSRQRMNSPEVALKSVVVCRGLPSNIHDPRKYARNLAQSSHWTRDPRVKVLHRPIKYTLEKNGWDERTKTHREGVEIIKRQEKGVDVLCALQLVKAALDPEVSHVILASQDTDLVPALDEVISLNTAFVETAAWYKPGDFRSLEIRPESKRIWNTRMNQFNYEASIDRSPY